MDNPLGKHTDYHDELAAVYQELSQIQPLYVVFGSAFEVDQVAAENQWNIVANTGE